MSKSKPIITARNIHRRFGTGELEIHVLRGIDLTIYEGEFVAIMGKSGAGKSTLMYQLSILDTPTSGDITIGDTLVTQLSEQEATLFRLYNLGYVFQNYALVPDLTAEENIMLPFLMRGKTTKQARAEARATLDRVGLEDKYTNLPNTLSGGQQQRVSVARAVAGTPRILFADEPTANLDSVSGQQVIDLLADINHKYQQTVVMVTHEREYASGCDRIVHLSDGVIVEIENLK